MDSRTHAQLLEQFLLGVRRHNKSEDQLASALSATHRGVRLSDQSGVWRGHEELAEWFASQPGSFDGGQFNQLTQIQPLSILADEAHAIALAHVTQTTHWTEYGDRITNYRDPDVEESLRVYVAIFEDHLIWRVNVFTPEGTYVQR